jgi:hypothetical protein
MCRRDRRRARQSGRGLCRQAPPTYQRRNEAAIQWAWDRPRVKYSLAMRSTWCWGKARWSSIEAMVSGQSVKCKLPYTCVQPASDRGWSTYSRYSTYDMHHARHTRPTHWWNGVSSPPSCFAGVTSDVTTNIDRWSSFDRIPRVEIKFLTVNIQRLSLSTPSVPVLKAYTYI